MSASRNPQLYVGGLSRDVRTYEVKDLFRKYGEIKDINQKNRYAFVVSFFSCPDSSLGVP